MTRDHKVAGFFCGKESLDDWIQQRALKSHRAGDSKVIVVTNEENEVVGYVAICSASVKRNEAVSKLRRNAPDSNPMGLIARLAVRSELQGQNIGPALLREAIDRIFCASDHIGIRGILVHAKDDNAMNFYTHMGFHSSPIDEKTMMVPMAEVIAELDQGPAD